MTEQPDGVAHPASRSNAAVRPSGRMCSKYSVGHSRLARKRPSEGGASDALEAPNCIGEPSGIRTLDPLIKSQVLYQLS